MQLQEDKKRFATLFSSFTGIRQGKIEKFLKDNNIRNVFEHPASLDATPKQLEKIELLKEMKGLYENLKSNEQTYRVNSSSAAQNYFANYFSNTVNKEKFVVAFLNSQNVIIQTLKIAEGTINEAPVYPREIVKLALQYDANSVILSHNHPGGSLKPSNADIEVTLKITRALKTVNIQVVDHIIVGKDMGTMSMAETGQMEGIHMQCGVTEKINKYEALGQKIEAGVASAEDIKAFNNLQEQQLKNSLESAKNMAAAMPEAELTR